MNSVVPPGFKGRTDPTLSARLSPVYFPVSENVLPCQPRFSFSQFFVVELSPIEVLAHKTRKALRFSESSVSFFSSSPAGAAAPDAYLCFQFIAIRLSPWRSLPFLTEVFRFCVFFDHANIDSLGTPLRPPLERVIAEDVPRKYRKRPQFQSALRVCE